MIVWLMQVGEALPVDFNICSKKLRTAMMADKLIESGHTVVWWSSSYDHFQKKVIFNDDTTIEPYNGLTIKALKGLKYKKNISLSRFVDHRLIANKFKNFAPAMPKPDIIIASMPSYDLAYQAVLFGNANSIPVIIDTRDQWPDIFLDVFPKCARKTLKFLLSKEFSMLEETMKRADGLTAVSGSFLSWCLKYAKREKTWKDEVFYLGGKKNIVSNKNVLEFEEKLRDKFVITFIGTFAKYHDPSILLKCAEELKEKDILFVIAGSGELAADIKQAGRNLPNLILPGWLNQEQISQLLSHSHIGICPTSLSADLFPNKAFTYMSTGLPVLTAFNGEMKEFVEKHDVGFYYPYDDAKYLSGCIEKLYYDKLLYEKMAQNSSKIFDILLDADTIYTNYVRYIEKMAERNI